MSLDVKVNLRINLKNEIGGILIRKKTKIQFILKNVLKRAKDSLISAV